jgi:hypothetical protein
MAPSGARSSCATNASASSLDLEQISEKADDARPALQGRFCLILLPVPEGLRVHPNLLCRFSLEQSEIKPPLLHVVA